MHPLWLVGFRPFFALACFSGLALPLLWVLIYRGLLPAPDTSFAAVQWHAHEMFFGFGWAVLGGFLLTATKNWVQVRGYHGVALMYLVAAWLFERIGMWSGGGWPSWLFELSNNLFLGSITAMLAWTLLRYRKQDDYRDNYFFLLIFPVFLLAKQLLLDPGHFQAGVIMATGLFRMAFLVMLERTLTQFMKNVFQVEHPAPRDAGQDNQAARAAAGRSRLPARSAGRRDLLAARAAADGKVHLLEAATGHAAPGTRHHVPGLHRHRAAIADRGARRVRGRRTGSARSRYMYSGLASWG